MNPERLQALLCLSRTRKDLAIGSAGTLWADENTPAGTLRCLNHVYCKKKAVRSSVLHRFIIRGKTWKKFNQVPTLVVPAHDGKTAHFFYATHEPVELNQEDIVHQAFDRNGIIHQPERIWTTAEVREKARQHNEYASADSKSTVYAQRFELLPGHFNYNEVVEDEVEEQPSKRARVGTNIVPYNLWDYY